MAQFFMSRARKLFQYVDLQGSTVPSPTSNEGRVTMSSNGDASVRIDEMSPNSTNNDNVEKTIRQKRRRRKFLILAGVVGVAVVMIIALTYHENATKLIAAIPSAFSSASQSSRTGNKILDWLNFEVQFDKK
jgi:hypothetical protein